MKKTITFLLCLALMVLPVQIGKADTNETVHAQWFTLCVAAVAVVVIGTAAYVVYKCERNAAEREKCESCQNPNKKEANFCANCGVPIRCEDCDTRLPKGATKCPSCETPVPPPSKPFTRLQMSTNGVTWTTIVSGPTKVESLSVIRFDNEAEFSSWAYRDDSLSVMSLPTNQQAYFRLSSD